MKQCAFCSNSANLTAEHVISKWISERFPGEKKTKYTDRHGQTHERISHEFDYKARVVCEECNNGWMSDIENNHAKPAAGPLIQGNILLPVGQSEARSLALFAFLKAVVVDSAQRHRAPFFGESVRDSFRTTLVIPNNVRMWMCAYAADQRGSFKIHAVHYQGDLTPTYPMEAYAATFGIGFFAFQVLAVNHFGSMNFNCPPGDEDAIPFWPHVPPGFVWPPKRAIMSEKQFDRFAVRWQQVRPLR